MLRTLHIVVQSQSFTFIVLIQNDLVSNLFSASFQWDAENQWFGAVQNPKCVAWSLCRELDHPDFQ